ncbi:MAG TPA: hypothetical protein VMS17_16720 [Gemmataceae bacterium]|nr:hypothetical protein [Gemmataceae bacterium]
MLPEWCRELLTAYVDGEMSASQRRRALRLLRRSSQARRLLQRLQSDSDALIHLPRVRPERDLSQPVLQKIGAQPTPLRRPRRIPAPRVYPAWIGAAAAAVVLCVLGAASYSFFAWIGHRATGSAVAQVPANPPAVVPPAKPPTADPDQSRGPSGDSDHKANPVVPAPAPPVDTVQRPQPAPNPPTTPDRDEPIFTSPGMEAFPELQSILPATDVVSTFKVRDVDEKKLAGVFSKESAFHVELPVPDANRAFERLRGVLKAHHVELLIDATADARLRHPNPKSQTNYILYTEDLTADDLVKLLQQLGAEDKKAAEKKAGDGIFDALVVHAMNENDHKVLKKLMGADLAPLAASNEAGPAGVDPRKPLSDQTGAQVAAALGQGKAGPKGATDHELLVLPYNPVQPKADSAEIKRFLDERKPMRPGALQILLVLRNPTKNK